MWYDHTNRNSVTREHRVGTQPVCKVVVAASEQPWQGRVYLTRRTGPIQTFAGPAELVRCIAELVGWQVPLDMNVRPQLPNLER